MPINAINVTIAVNPVNVPCPPAGGVCTVTATVTGIAAGRGGSYDVFIYDQDLVAVLDDCLDSNVANGVLKGAFKRQHTFILHCDENCNVVGRLGSSGEQTAEIYAWVDGGRNITAMSKVVPVSCTSCPVPEQKEKTKRTSARQTKKRSALT